MCDVFLRCSFLGTGKYSYFNGFHRSSLQNCYNFWATYHITL
jgi:hypothetical protein